MMTDKMKLHCNLIGQNLAIRPAPAERGWMDKTPNRFAYRCLPLTIANQYGWEILNPTAFCAAWDGTDGKEAIIITPDDHNETIAASHFGCGILTFQIAALFRTDPGIDLIATGPINYPKDGIYPLTGIVETDWSPMTFTYNMRFTRPRKIVRFEANEPICTLIPSQRGMLERFDPTSAPIQNSPSDAIGHAEWSQSRSAFLKRDTTGEKASDGWQKDYTRGSSAGQTIAPKTHRTSLKLKPFRPGLPSKENGQ